MGGELLGAETHSTLGQQIVLQSDLSEHVSLLQIAMQTLRKASWDSQSQFDCAGPGRNAISRRSQRRRLFSCMTTAAISSIDIAAELSWGTLNRVYSRSAWRSS